MKFYDQMEMVSTYEINRLRGDMAAILQLSCDADEAPAIELLKQIGRIAATHKWPTKPLLVAPPVTKGKAELQEEFNQALKDSQPAILEKMRPYMNDHDRLKLKLNQVVDDYDLTSNDTRRGD